MPTIPSEGSGPPANEPHEYRQAAESFGSDAERYDRARPRYPEALVERIVSGNPGTGLLDVGCGTGIAARQFQAAGCTVLGVDPDPRMADVARRLGTEVEVARFEAWDPAGRDFDAVVAAQSWHWVDPVVGAAVAQRVLRPRGRFAAFWHVLQLPAEVGKATAAACRRAMPDSPFDFEAMTRPAVDVYRPMLAKAADGIREVGGFDEPEEWTFTWEWSYTRDAWLDVMPTQGALTRLPADTLASVLEEVGTAIDAMGGRFTMPYTTVAVTAVRAGAA
ncbi:class I SAM-dependent methyltransferase [Streptomyces rhizosphaerihabitans]|uniref:class I SAM-dependent methyltransferase n=1 Tax=Streptomyces rhizosphaerihabitans TaxID=1266770 RepID=UPI0021C019CE|nr:class I SAM-dependent methyltransferase [Streptomyces rhizosphaerihabitans]MCT9007894.1 class I SAM-dependent methyltransferase [Streptomyces rhizosphaerihabitans]